MARQQGRDLTLNPLRSRRNIMFGTMIKRAVGSRYFNHVVNGLLAVAFLAWAIGLALFTGTAEVLIVLASAPMRSTDFKAIVEPILNREFDGVYDQRKDEWKGVFREAPGIARAYHEEPVLYGMGMAPEMPDGMPVTYQQGGILYTKRYVYKQFGQAYAMTNILVEDGDHVSLGSLFARHLAQSLIETKETKTANELNRAFNASFPGGDGVALCSNAHPVIGGTQSNLLTTAAALSQTSLEQMLIQIRKARDSNGKFIRLSSEKLVVGPDNVLQAEVLLKSVLRTGTNNNDINPVKSGGLLDQSSAVISRLTSTTGWYVKTDAPEGMKILTRRRMTRSMEGDFETDSMRYKATERYETGWTDWRAIFGTPGV
jgi:hypothetical protein